MTQPQAIKTVCDFAKAVGAVRLFDAGDVQANGFQIVEDDRPFETFTETGASYIGYAVRALMASAIADAPSRTIALTGDGSFMMIRKFSSMRSSIDFVPPSSSSTTGRWAPSPVCNSRSTRCSAHRVRLSSTTCASRRGNGVRALDGGATPESLDMASDEAHAYNGLSVIRVPVYGGAPDPVGGWVSMARGTLAVGVPLCRRIMPNSLSDRDRERLESSGVGRHGDSAIRAFLGGAITPWPAGVGTGWNLPLFTRLAPKWSASISSFPCGSQGDLDTVGPHAPLAHHAPCTRGLKCADYLVACENCKNPDAG